MRFEVVITVWQDGLFKRRERIESDDVEFLVMKVPAQIRHIEFDVNEEEAKSKQQWINDDIPF